MHVGVISTSECTKSCLAAGRGAYSAPQARIWTGEGNGKKEGRSRREKREGKLGNDGNKLGKGGGCYDLLLGALVVSRHLRRPNLDFLDK